jgi:hypothetical protein
MYKLEERLKDGTWKEIEESSDYMTLELAVIQIQEQWRDITLRILYKAKEGDWRIDGHFEGEGTRHAVKWYDGSVSLFHTEEEARAAAGKTTRAEYFGSVAY